LLPNLFRDNDNDNEPLFAPVDNLVIPTNVGPLADDPLFEQEWLRREVELLMMQAEQDDAFQVENGGDDATITNVMEDMQFLGACINILYIHCFITYLGTDINSDSDDNPGDDHFAETRFDGDYAPYPNKVVCPFLLHVW
jgi:hypothetical protein